MKGKIINSINGLLAFRKRISVILLLILSLAAAAVIVVNMYSVRILSSARAYVNGESEYSKGKKDASAYLINYISLHNKSDYAAFQRSIAIPKGDHVARIALITPPIDYRLVKEGLLAGKNHPEDIDNMIWLFQTFQHLPMFEKAVEIWTEGDEMINDLDQIAASAHTDILRGGMSDDEKRAMVMAINKNSAALTIKEQAFSETLGNISRQINTYVFTANVFITLVIVFCVADLGRHHDTQPGKFKEKNY